MGFIALAHVGIFASPVPTWDDWDLVPVLTGREPFDLEWLWTQHNEHRIPLPKLLHILLGRATGDGRSAIVLGVAMLALPTALLIRVAGQIRGRVAYTDAFFPIVLMQLGHYELLQVPFVLQNALASSIGLLLLAAIAATRGTSNPALIAWFGIGLVLLPLCGSNGAALVPALTVFSGSAALIMLRTRGLSDAAGIWPILGGAFLALAIAVLSVVTLEPVEIHNPTREPLALLRTTLQFAGASFGPAGALAWGGGSWSLLGLLAVPFVALGAFVLIENLGDRSIRLRTLGMLLFMGAMISLALAVAWGRAGMAPLSGAENRYTILAAPLLCVLYLVGTNDRRTVRGEWIERGLFFAIAILVVYNTAVGISAGARRSEALEAPRLAIQKGIAPRRVADQYGDRLHPAHPPRWIAERLEMLREAGFAPYGPRAKGEDHNAR